MKCVSLRALWNVLAQDINQKSYNVLFLHNCLHGSDSIQGTDYIANYFFLNLRVSKAKIENLKWWIGGDIIPLTFEKFVTILVQKLKILGRKTDL